MLENNHPARGLSFFESVGPLGLLTSIFFFNFICRIILSPLLPELEKDLGISHGQAGALFLFISAGYCISLPCSGIVSSKLAHRGAIALSAILVGSVLFIIPFCKEINQIRPALFVLGMASGLYLPSGIAAITDLVQPRQWGRALGVHELAPNFAFVAAPLLAGAFLHRLGWQNLIMILGSASIGVGLIFAIIGKGGESYGKPPGLRSFYQLLSQKAFWIITALFALGISSTVGIFAMLPLYLVSSHSMELAQANSIVGLSRVMSLGAALGAGWITDRLGPERAMVIVFAGMGVSTILMGILTGPQLLVAVFIQPVFAVCFFPAGFVALSKIGPSSTRNVAVSLAVPLGFLLGGGALPAIIGRMGQEEMFGQAIAVSGVLMCCGVAGAMALKLPPEPRK